MMIVSCLLAIEFYALSCKVRGLKISRGEFFLLERVCAQAASAPGARAPAPRRRPLKPSPAAGAKGSFYQPHTVAPTASRPLVCPALAPDRAKRRWRRPVLAADAASRAQQPHEDAQQDQGGSGGGAGAAVAGASRFSR